MAKKLLCRFTSVSPPPDQEELGYRLLYPTYREGLRALLHLPRPLRERAHGE